MHVHTAAQACTHSRNTCMYTPGTHTHKRAHIQKKMECSIQSAEGCTIYSLRTLAHTLLHTYMRTLSPKMLQSQ